MSERYFIPPTARQIELLAELGMTARRHETHGSAAWRINRVFALRRMLDAEEAADNAARREVYSARSARRKWMDEMVIGASNDS